MNSTGMDLVQAHAVVVVVVHSPPLPSRTATLQGFSPHVKKPRVPGQRTLHTTLEAAPTASPIPPRRQRHQQQRRTRTAMHQTRRSHRQHQRST